MQRLNYYAPERQIEALVRLSEETELPVAEWLRRMTDYCLQERVLNQLLPAMSGQLKVQER